MVKSIGGFYYVKNANDEIQECRAAGRFRLEDIKPLVGDFVSIVEEENGKTHLITQIAPRRNQLIRPLVANVDALAIILSPAKPRSDLLLIDRLINQARLENIEPIIIVNKMDVWPDEGNALLKSYAEAAQVYAVSAATGAGLEVLGESFRDKTICLTGQSAVGKSTLLNRICGCDLQQTGGLSRKTDRGKHTTRVVEIFAVPDLNASLIDTPGFSILSPAASESETPLAALYPEFRPFEAECRFDTCRHIKEPDCAVKTAVEQGKIDAGRYERYVQLATEFGDVT